MRGGIMAARRTYTSGNGGRRIPRGAVLIYDEIEEIKARKGGSSNWPNEYFKHKFVKGKGKIYGLPDGSLLVIAPYPLWDIFDYPE
jgi:hypothetical protein